MSLCPHRDGVAYKYALPINVQTEKLNIDRAFCTLLDKNFLSLH